MAAKVVINKILVDIYWNGSAFLRICIVDVAVINLVALALNQVSNPQFNVTGAVFDLGAQIDYKDLFIGDPIQPLFGPWSVEGGGVFLTAGVIVLPFCF